VTTVRVIAGSHLDGPQTPAQSVVVRVINDGAPGRAHGNRDVDRSAALIYT
jgi:hypothetical protein